MSNWGYVAIAYTVVWGALAAYAVALARRITQAERVARGLQSALHEDLQADQEDALCDTPPAP